MSPVMSHHLTKLHKKALVAGTTSSLAQVSTIDYAVMGSPLSYNTSPPPNDCSFVTLFYLCQSLSLVLRSRPNLNLFEAAA